MTEQDDTKETLGKLERKIDGLERICSLIFDTKKVLLFVVE